MSSKKEIVSPAVRGMFGVQVRAKVALCRASGREYIRLQEQNEDGTWSDVPGYNCNNMEAILLSLMGEDSLYGAYHVATIAEQEENEQWFLERAEHRQSTDYEPNY